MILTIPAKVETMDSPSPELQRILDNIPPGDEWGVLAANAIISEGLRAGLSDLHLVPQRDRLYIQGRREDLLSTLAGVPRKNQDILIARLKVMARVPAFVKTEAQDGRLEWRAQSGDQMEILRAAFLPTLHGEAVTIRFPERVTVEMSLDDLGMGAKIRDALLKMLNRREGVFFTTGPSGSGKTTTLYALMRYLNQKHGDRMSFFTIEDPIEKELPFAAQVQVNDQQNSSFERSLRATLRQSPNVLLIGEVRDRETAAIAVQAGMTGHLVLSTLHAGRAAQVPARLLSLNLDPYLVASALAGSMAQRLVRVSTGPNGSVQRRGLFELLPFNEEIRGMIFSGAPIGEFLQLARKSQAGDLVESARGLYASGVLSQDELYLSMGEDMS